MRVFAASAQAGTRCANLVDTAGEVECFDRQIVVNAIENFPAALERVF
jgi:hypothetical protein